MKRGIREQHGQCLFRKMLGIGWLEAQKVLSGWPKVQAVEKDEDERLQRTAGRWSSVACLRQLKRGEGESDGCWGREDLFT